MRRKFYYLISNKYKEGAYKYLKKIFLDAGLTDTTDYDTIEMEDNELLAFVSNLCDFPYTSTPYSKAVDDMKPALKQIWLELIPGEHVPIHIEVIGHWPKFNNPDREDDMEYSFIDFKKRLAPKYKGANPYGRLFKYIERFTYLPLPDEYWRYSRKKHMKS